MLIEEAPLTHWINKFYGYGSWKARFWFVSYEESGGAVPEDVAERINYFNTLQYDEPALVDIRELYRHVAMRWEGPRSNKFMYHHDYRFGNDAMLNGVWKNLVAFEHGYLQQPLPDPLEYQKNTFASPLSQEAMIKLYPLPSPHGHSWYYSWLDLPQMGFLKTRAAYEEHVFENRLQTIISKIKTHKPEIVLLYGMNNINNLKNTFQVSFHKSKFKMVKATTKLTPQHHRADLDGTILLITTQIPALRHNRIETGFDWEEFGKRVKSNRDF